MDFKRKKPLDIRSGRNQASLGAPAADILVSDLMGHHRHETMSPHDVIQPMCELAPSGQDVSLIKSEWLAMLSI